MKNLTFFLASDLSPHILKKLKQHKFQCEHARTNLLNTVNAQFNYCVSNNMVMVTKSKKLFIFCRKIRHPVIWLKGNADEVGIQEKVNDYIREVKILKNAI